MGAEPVGSEEQIHGERRMQPKWQLGDIQAHVRPSPAPAASKPSANHSSSPCSSLIRHLPDISDTVTPGLLKSNGGRSDNDRRLRTACSCRPYPCGPAHWQCLQVGDDEIATKWRLIESATLDIAKLRSKLR